MTANCPKPLLPVAGRPFLDYPVQSVLDAGFDRILLLAGYQGEQVEDYAAGWRGRGVRIDCIVETEPAGTGGALHHARELLEETFLLLNGDSFFGFNPRDLESIAPGEPWMAKIALRHLADAGRYGAIETDGERITAFREKSAASAGLINAGTYLLNRAVLEAIPPPPSSIERDVFPRLTAQRWVFGRAYHGEFIDIGVPDDFARAQSLFASGMPKPVA